MKQYEEMVLQMQKNLDEYKTDHDKLIDELQASKDTEKSLSDMLEIASKAYDEVEN